VMKFTVVKPVKEPARARWAAKSAQNKFYPNKC
jgi:hypothetical protein